MANDPSRDPPSVERRSSGSRPARRSARRSIAREPRAGSRREVSPSLWSLALIVARLRVVFGTAVTAELALRAQGAERDLEIADCLREGVSVPLVAQMERLSRLAERERRVTVGSVPPDSERRGTAARRVLLAGKDRVRVGRHQVRTRHDTV